MDEATRKNITAILAHSEKTRELVREADKRIEDYKRMNKMLVQNVSILQDQMQKIQVKLFSGGPTS